MLSSNNPRTADKGKSTGRKRNRAVLSCLSCHQRRVKCDRSQPCSACISRGWGDSCTFESSEEMRARSGESSSGRCDAGEKRQAQQPSLPPSGLLPVPNPTSFAVFVDRFLHRSTQADRLDAQQTTPAAATAYPPGSIASIKTALLDLPEAEGAELMVQFFMEQLDWMYEAGDYDDMERWLGPFLQKRSRHSLPGSLDELVKGDATRLCLVMTMLAATIQVASESLIRMYFLDAMPVGLSHAAPLRSVLQDRYETRIHDLLNTATQYDGASADLVRCGVIYMHFLKNEGRLGHPGNQPLMTSLSQLVEKARLHLDPDASFPPPKRESHRRLFWTFYFLNRLTCAHFGYPIELTEDMITTQEPAKESWSPLMGRRVHLTTIYRVEVARIAGQLLAMMQQSSVNAEEVVAIEDRFQAFVRSLPPELHPSMPPLAPDMRQLRTFDLQRHIFHIYCDSVHGALHRICFFPTPSIPQQQVQQSRQICVESAVNTIRVQKRLRMRLVSEHHLRCFYVPYFLLEASITLILASLVELGDTLPGKAVSETAHDYIRWARRARDILNSVPSDFTPAVQAIRLLSRVLDKAIQIVGLHAQHRLSSAESDAAIREVLCDEKGGRPSIPFLEMHSFARLSPPCEDSQGRGTEGDARSSSFGWLGPRDESTALTTPFSAGGSGMHSSMAGNLPSGVSTATVEPTYADLGIDFFNTLALALPNPFSTLANPQESIQDHPLSISASANQQQDSQLGLDDQMDSWLASLQHYA